MTIANIAIVDMTMATNSRGCSAAVKRKVGATGSFWHHNRARPHSSPTRSLPFTSAWHLVERRQQPLAQVLSLDQLVPEIVLVRSCDLAPMRLTPYELLWILDYLPPMNFRYYTDGAPYDPNHRRKLRLFESVSASYAKLKSSAGAS